MDEPTRLRERAAYYREAAAGADLASREELLRIARDFEEQAAERERVAHRSTRP